MKKLSFLVLALAMGLTLSACGPKTESGKNLDKGNNALGADQSESFSGSLKDLIGRNKPLKCTYSDGSSQSGTVYVSGDKVRVQVSAEVDGQKTMVNSLKLGTWQYMWREGDKAGTKFNFTEEEIKQMQEKAKQYNQPEAANTVDFDTRLDYKCMSWSSDESTFSVPGEVEFTDMTSMMKKTLSEMDTQIQSVCSACTNLTGTAKTECMKLCQ